MLVFTPLLSFARKFRAPVLTCPQGDSLYLLHSKGSSYRMIPSLWVERLERFRCRAQARQPEARGQEAKAARCPKARPPGLGGSQSQRCNDRLVRTIGGTGASKDSLDQAAGSSGYVSINWKVLVSKYNTTVEINMALRASWVTNPTS
ncbi:hypothetical protein C8N40_11012 [Pontibacter mucosus]|uniref:Uncharacterized protein n=1 Tax=Pontibacter mucosus TaxID=1649266 RepID=A0A2T5YDG1_9BACT|nr:hypothetical protein C8N40_11012 [Pontibacter mucosus]